MLHAFGAMHCVDFSQGQSTMQTAEQKRAAQETLLPILSNLCIVFLKRGDDYNSVRAADLCLEFMKRLPGEEMKDLQAKVLYRRALAKGQRREFADALADLRQSARLRPADKEIRRVLENCKVALQRERGAPDDRWRGLLTESPTKARLRARCLRRLRRASALPHEVLRGLRKRENQKVAALLVLGPLMSIAAPYLVTRLLSHKRA